VSYSTTRAIVVASTHDTSVVAAGKKAAVTNVCVRRLVTSILVRAL